MKVHVFWYVYISPSPWLYHNSWGCAGLHCPLYYSPHPADNVLLLLLQGWGVIKLVWDRFITPLLGELSILFRNSIVGDFWGWTVESFICRYPFPLPLGVAANNAYRYFLSVIFYLLIFICYFLCVTCCLMTLIGTCCYLQKNISLCSCCSSRNY